MKETVIWISGLLLSAAIASRVDPGSYSGGRSRDPDARIRRNGSAVARLLGGFRTSASDLLFIKTELYHHGGVAYAPHSHDDHHSHDSLDAEIDEHGHESHDCDELGHDHRAETLIPTEDRDFRGFVGRLHRQVKPWRDPSLPHVLSNTREMLPLFRLMTKIDPSYVRGYAAGSFFLQLESLDSAFAFLDEGIRHNPDAFQLYSARGVLWLKKARLAGRYSPEAPPHFKRAYDDFHRAAELALVQRPPESVLGTPRGDAVWEPHLDNDAAAACHLAARLASQLGDPSAGAALARRYLTIFPDSAPLRSIANPPPR